MSPLNLSEESRRYNYLVLTTKVVQVLQAAKRGKELTGVQVKILNRGINLLSGIKEGSAFAEGKKENGGLQPPTQKEITMYGYALVTVKQLDLTDKDKNIITDYFSDLLEILKQLEKKKEKDNLDLSKPNEFFLILGNALREDIQQERYMPKTDTLLSKKNLTPNVTLLT
ncbi:MAG: hypothetical protein ACE5KZ_10845 [Candidatus Scalinduaceae bacterium]